MTASDCSTTGSLFFEPVVADFGTRQEWRARPRPSPAEIAEVRRADLARRAERPHLLLRPVVNQMSITVSPLLNCFHFFGRALFAEHLARVAALTIFADVRRDVGDRSGRCRRGRARPTPGRPPSSCCPCDRTAAQHALEVAVLRALLHEIEHDVRGALEIAGVLQRRRTG
jgi:hypothetical protein